MAAGVGRRQRSRGAPEGRFTLTSWVFGRCSSGGGWSKPAALCLGPRDLLGALSTIQGFSDDSSSLQVAEEMATMKEKLPTVLWLSEVAIYLGSLPGQLFQGRFSTSISYGIAFSIQLSSSELRWSSLRFPCLLGRASLALPWVLVPRLVCAGL